MTLKILDAMGMNGILMLAEDEYGEQQVFYRLWDVRNEDKGVWLQANMTGPHVRKMDQDEAEHCEMHLMPLLTKYLDSRQVNPEIERKVKAAFASIRDALKEET